MTSTFFIAHTKPTHPQKGKGVTFFIREQISGDAHQATARTIVVEKEVPHYFYTPNMDRAQAKEVCDDIANRPEIKALIEKGELTIRLEGYNSQKSFLRAAGSKEHRLLLPKPFIRRCDKEDNNDPCGINSPSHQLRFFYPPFTLLRSLDDITDPLERRKSAYTTVDSIVSDSYAVIDIEVENWQIGNPSIFMAVYVSPTSHVIFHSLPFNDSSYKNFTLVQCKNQEEIGTQLTKIVLAEDPLKIMGHNIMAFDQRALRDLTGEYFPSPTDHYPVTKSTQGLPKVITEGRMTIDTYCYTFNYKNIFLNNKLETVAGFEKSIDYEEQAQLVAAAHTNDHDAFLKLIGYCTEDGIHTEAAAKILEKTLVLKAVSLRRDLDSICTTSKAALAEDYWKRRHFLIKRAPEDTWRSRRDNSDALNPDAMKMRHLPIGFSQGFFNETHIVYFTPFIAAGRKILEKIHPELLGAFRTSADPIEKYDHAQTLQAQLSYLVEQAIRIVGDEDKLLQKRALTKREQNAFYCLFAYHGLTTDRKPIMTGTEFITSIRAAFQKIRAGLNNYTIINTGRKFHFLGRKPDVKRLEDDLHGFYMGAGKTISFDRGRVIANPFLSETENRFLYDGINPEKGSKPNFIRRLYREVISKLFTGEDQSEVKAYIAREYSALTKGKSNYHDYFIPTRKITYDLYNLEESIGKSNIEKSKKEEFAKLKKRIAACYSDDALKGLEKFVYETCIKSNNGADILHSFNGVVHPYPPKIDVVWVNWGGSSNNPHVITLPAKTVYGQQSEPHLPTYAKHAERAVNELYAVIDATVKRSNPNIPQSNNLPPPKQGELFTYNGEQK